MSVPNFSGEVKKLYDTGLFNLKTHDGQGAFVDACLSMLHGLDANWGHLIKKPGQTSVHDHAEDAALYKLPDGKAQAVDFIGGAGGPNPQPGWMVDSFIYKHSDWFDPTDHGITEGSAQPPAIVMPPGREEALDEMKYLDYYYTAPEGLQRPNGLSLNGKPDFEGIAAWYLDVYQRERLVGNDRPTSRAAYVNDIRHSDEWKQKHPGEQP